VPLQQAIAKMKAVPLDGETVLTATSLGIALSDQKSIRRSSTFRGRTPALPETEWLAQWISGRAAPTESPGGGVDDELAHRALRADAKFS
jgi:hypothetical protein